MVPFGIALRDENSPALPGTSKQPIISSQPPAGRPPHVLVVDDLPIMRAAIRRLLEHAGMEVVAESGNADETIAALSAHSPDVVVIDLRVNRMDAISVIRKVRMTHPSTRVVVHTGSIRSELLAKAVEAGAIGVPSRDGTPWELLRAIDRAYRTGSDQNGSS